MNNDPASLTDPNGLAVGDRLEVAGRTGIAAPQLSFMPQWADKEWQEIFAYTQGRNWNGGNPALRTSSYGFRGDYSDLQFSGQQLKKQSI